MNLGLGGGLPAAGEGAALVPGEEGEALAGAGQAACAAVGEGAEVLVEHDGEGFGVDPEPHRGLDAEVSAVVGGGLSGAGFELVEGHADDQGGRHPRGRRQVPGR